MPSITGIAIGSTVYELGAAPLYPIPVGGSPIVYLTQGGADDYLNIAALFTSPPGTTYALAAASAGVIPNSWTFEPGVGVLITDTSLVAPTLTLTFEATYDGRTVSQALSFEPGFIAARAKSDPADLALVVGTAMTPVDLGASFDGDRPLVIDAAPGYAALPAWMTLTPATVNGVATTMLGGTPTAPIAATTIGIRARNTDPEGNTYSDTVSCGLFVQAAGAVPVFTRDQAITAESTVVGARVYRNPGPIIAPADTPVLVDWIRTTVAVARGALTLPPEATIIPDLTGTEILAPPEAAGQLIQRRTRGLDAQGTPVVANVSPPVGPFTAAVVAPTALGGVAIPDLTVGVAMTAIDFNAAFGGTKPQTLTLDATSDALPPGLAFVGGVLSGTPTVADAAVSLVVRATNSAGFATVSDSLVIAAAGGVPFTTYVEQLRDRTRPNGRTSTNSLKVPGVAALPAGSTRSGQVVTINSYSGNPLDYEDWDFRDFMVDVKAGAVLPGLKQSIFGQSSLTVAPLYPLRIYGDIDALEFCEFVRAQGPLYTPGFSTFIYQVPTANAAGDITAYGKLRRAWRCRLDGAREDCLKILGDARPGGQIWDECYFAPPQNIPAGGTTLYASGTTFGLDRIVHIVHTNGTLRYFRSLVAGNVGNALPAFGSSNAFWATYDPHADAATTNASLGEGIEFLHCLFDWTNDPIGPGGPYVQNGVTNAWRLSRDTGKHYPVGPITFRENILHYTQGDDGYPIEVKDGGEPNWIGPISFINNRIQPNKNGAIYSPASQGMIHVWEGNRVIATDALIPAPTLRPLTATTPVLGRVTVGIGPARSNEDYMLFTDRTHDHNNSLLARPSLSKPNFATFYGQTMDGPLFTMPVNNTTGAYDTGVNTDPNGCHNMAVLTFVEWVEQKYGSSIELLDVIDLAKAGMTPPDVLNAGGAWPFADFTGTLARVGREPDILFAKWDMPTKERYLRRANTAAPAAAVTLPLGNGQAHSFWNTQLADGTKGGTEPPAFSTNTKLAVMPEDTAANRATLKAMYADADWQKILAGGFDAGDYYLGRWDSVAADGGHPYSDSVAGQALGAMTAWIPYFIAYMHERGVEPLKPRMSGRRVAFRDGPAGSKQVLLELVNGGVMQPPLETWGMSFTATPRCDHQVINYVHIARAGEADTAFTPVMRPGSTGYTSTADSPQVVPSAANHQGTIAVVSTGETIASVLTSDGETVLNARWAIIGVTPLVAHPWAPGDRLAVGRTWWPWVDNGNSPDPRNPALSIPKEFVEDVAPPGCLRRFVGFDFDKFQTGYTVSADTGGAAVGAPVVVQDGSSTSTHAEGAAFTFDPAKKYVLALLDLSGTSTVSDDLLTVRVGAQGRAAGTGTLVARGVGSDGTAAWKRNGRAEISVYPISGLSGSQTITVDATTAPRRLRTILMEVPNFSGALGRVHTVSGTNTGWNETNATTAVDSRVLTMICTLDGTDADDITVGTDPSAGGATALVDGHTNGAGTPSASLDARIWVGHKAAPTVGNSTVTWTSPISNVAVSMSVELLKA